MKVDDIISYHELVTAEKANLQKGMNFGIGKNYSVGRIEDLSHTRLIHTPVKVEVWQRDGGQCVLCGSKNNLHYDHEIPFSKGGSSIVAQNIRLLCARHNLSKSDKIITMIPWVTTSTTTILNL